MALDLGSYALWPAPAIGACLGYCAGSIPFGLLLTRWAGTADIRSIGSGNIGATNVLRTGRRDLAAATLVMDAFKGTAAVLLAGVFGEPAALAAAAAAFFGHLFPVWLRFRGGKGVATYLGVLVGLHWAGALIFAVAWLAVAATSRYSSAAALAASAVAPPALLALRQPSAAVLMFALTLVLWWKHRLNIKRLRNGTEGRIGQKG